MSFKIKHYPVFDVEKVFNEFAARGENIRYVCTTELDTCNFPIDIFIRDDGPHPQFGNLYFGLYTQGGQTFICNADSVETLEFACLDSSNGTYHYSQYRHDFREVEDGVFIDGGRAYSRIVGTIKKCRFFVIRDGYFVDITNQS